MIYGTLGEYMNQTTKKMVNRYFNGIPKTRLIVSIEQPVINEIDKLINHNRSHPAYKNRSEFVRMAIAIVEKLERIVVISCVQLRSVIYC